MIIEDCRSNEKKFESTKIGECFEFNDEIYIKTDISNHPRNAFSFAHNTLGYFKSDDIVTPIRAKVVIE